MTNAEEEFVGDDCGGYWSPLPLGYQNKANQQFRRIAAGKKGRTHGMEER
ncbi:hypothetical protein [Caballeronia sp. TF1N1]|nr:hypothetical protein [Caballeronia sp. TF1N1]